MLDKSKSYKIDVTELTQEERIALQEKLFTMGYRRCIDGIDGSYSYLVLDNIGNIGYISSKEIFKQYHGITLNPCDIVLAPEPTITPQGITLRDYFAGCALSAMAGITESGVSTYDGMTLKSVAKEVYQVADAMLEERNK